MTLCLGVMMSMMSWTSFAREQTEVQIQIHGKTLTLELADTPEERAQGLQNRKSLCQDCGMLFQFEMLTQVGFWMKNTYLPLDIAYLDGHGKITKIGQMKPLSLKSLPSPDETLYAWEMNQGWFAANNIKVGDRVTLLP